MSVETQFTIFSDFYTGVMNQIRGNTGQSAVLSQVKRAVNVAIQDMHLGQDYNFYWAEREAILALNPPYSTGTVSITQGDTTLTGSGTAWDSNNVFGVANARAGGKIKLSGSVIPYRVTSVDSATSIEIPIYIGSTLSDDSYTYYEDEAALPSDYLRPVNMQFFDDNREIVLVDRRQFKRAMPRNIVTGRPKWATQIELGPSGSTTMRPRMVFTPPPDQAYRIPYSYITNQLVVATDGTGKTGFTADDDEPIVPLRYRHAIFWYACKLMYQHKDDARRAECEQEYSNIMQRTLQDTNVGENRVRIEPQMRHYTNHAHAPFSGRGRFRRWDTNDRFDRME